MQALFRRIERVAPIDVPVLILGETGTGKELVARAIHQLSRRRERRFEVVNCGALTRELLLTELFGHERGAFTGAVARKPGLLVVADGGTVFLDEVGDLPLDAQVMLLRVLQDGEIRPVGSTQTVRVDVRLVAATHRDLETEVERGAFREDLYYRLRRVLLEVPPLRARREDIPLIVEHFRVRVNRRYGLSVRGLRPAALGVLDRQSWRGNVRDLEGVVEQAMIFQGEGWITPEGLDLPPTGRPPVADRRTGETPRIVESQTVGLTWVQEDALRIAVERGEVRRRDVIIRCGISREAARRQLVGLVERGLLRRIGSGRGARYRVHSEAG
jgi:DNA-binding NtrC family response regulator